MDLKPGEILCDICNGVGDIVVEPFDDEDISWHEICPKCKGYKKLDWIEVITGVTAKPEMIPF